MGSGIAPPPPPSDQGCRPRLLPQTQGSRSNLYLRFGGAGPALLPSSLRYWRPFDTVFVFSFIINFKVGSSGDIALHINPRIGESVVRNSFMNGSWGSEERKVSYNPFGPGQFFDVSLGGDPFPPPTDLGPAGPHLSPPPQLSIRCGTDRFKVFANGQHLFDYNHRFQAFQRVDVMEIKGDITLSYVQI